VQTYYRVGARNEPTGVTGIAHFVEHMLFRGTVHFGLADVTGSVRPGLDADFAVVDADLSHLPAAEIGTAAVTTTWVRGQAVYQAT